jgi:hypothetical protein
VDVTMPVHQESFCVGVRETLNHHLAAVINKAAFSIGDEDILRLPQPYTTFSAPSLNFWRFLYSDPVGMLAAGLGIVVLVSAPVILVVVRRRRKKNGCSLPNYGRQVKQNLSFYLA